LSDYTWRAAQETDLPALENLDAACRQADGPASVTWSTYRDLLAAPGLPILCATHNLTGPQIVAAGWAQDKGERVRLWGKVHPEHRRKRLGTHLLRWTEAHAVALGNTTDVVILNEAFNEGSAALYLQEGYTCDFVENWMQRDLREPLPSFAQALPSVTWTEENAMLFFEAYSESFKTRRRPGSPPPIADEWIKGYVEDADFRPDLSLLAHADGKPVGFITAGVMNIKDLGQTVGWISQIGVHLAWRGRGTAAGLLTAVMHSFKREGFDTGGLHVNVDNSGAIQLYEQLGFKLVGQRAKYSKSTSR
jgi:mycothiol synthase